ncbi:acyl-CoA synthetase [Rhodococcus sp. IEGM 1409]|uniref:acyl-CoA synthetase n=1 Tax=Rhodococcus sp. IEGM 1409 TaxID=3047082 RepID=UPI0024B6A55E|nr:acyl-CoA synthetase [Rhodococcus sp. IEGM 1409]MDI9901502.1 acyl-CoA synthetase [Rhodococcus sp. IEGM 1409]
MSALEELAGLEAVALSDRDLPASTYELIERSAKRHPDKIALHLLPGGTGWREPNSWSYSQLLSRVNKAANLFAALDVPSGGVVALMLPNSGSAYAALWGAQALGIVNPVNPMLAREHLIDIFTLTEAEILLAPAPGLDLLLWQKALDIAAAVPTVRMVLAVGGPPQSVAETATGDFDLLCAEQSGSNLEFEERRTLNDVAAYFHTGGTTGAPKVAAHTHLNEVSLAWSLAQRTEFVDAVVLSGLPLFHVNAVHVTGLAPLYGGSTIVALGPLGYRDRMAVEDFWRIVEHFEVSLFSGVPTVFSSLPEVPTGVDISSLRCGIVGAAPLPARVRRHFESNTGVPMIEGYGLTEATCASVLEPLGGRVPGTTGLRLPYQHVKAVDVDAGGAPIRDCPAGEVGILAIKGPCVFPGYLRRHSQDARLDSSGSVFDGWLVTGDRGSVDGQGFVSLGGRAKDLIIRGGHNIDPRTIEEVLLQHPDVDAVAAVGRPHAHSGEVPVAYVVLSVDSSPDIDALLTWAGAHAPEPAAAPVFIHEIDELPLTAVGKVFKVPLVHDATRRVVDAELVELGLRGRTVIDGDRVSVQLAEDTADDRADQLRDRLLRYHFESEVSNETRWATGEPA